MQSDTLPKISDLESTEQTMRQPDSGKKSGGKKNLLWFLCGILWGITLTFIAGVYYLRHNLIQEIPIEGSFSGAANKVGPVAQKYGWQVSYNDCGLPRLIDNQPMEVYRFCKSGYAYELLQDENDRKIACMLPCAISIYQKSDGVTYLSKLNMPLITQLLGGSSIGIFSEKISPEQRAIMSHFPEKHSETK
jgi:hypothetical protein